MTLSKPAKTDAGGWWIVHATAMFCSRATFLRKVIMRTADAESTPLVGSSRNKIFGRLTSASATESRRLLPEDRPRMISLVHLGGALGHVQVAAVQRHCVLQVLAGGEGCPKGVELLDVGADAVIHVGGEWLAVDADVAGG